MNDQDITILKQSVGADPKTKRNSGLFSFLRWFKSSSRESINSDQQTTVSGGNNSGGSTESLNSTGTAASFSFIPPDAYKNNNNNNKCVSPGPETDTYKARLKQRDKVRERDKNITLRKKYNLFFNRDTFNKRKSLGQSGEEENCKSLPLMTRKMDADDNGEKGHRRTNSDSSKQKKAGAYLHVKGKRKAPQPPRNSQSENTLSLRRKKRLAPQPPAIMSERIFSTLERAKREDQLIYADADVIYNDSLKLEHGMLKANKFDDPTTSSSSSSSSSSNNRIIEAAPVSPRPWYKRNVNNKKENKYEPIEKTNSVSLFSTNPNGNRKSGLMFLTNISELDREATEIYQKEYKKNETALTEMPEFMKPKQDEPNTDTVPKRKSAKDLIAKFNAITNVTKVTVNSALFGGGGGSNAVGKEKRDYFGRAVQKSEGNRSGFVPLMKSETSACILKPMTPKQERKGWSCPKCRIENDYWRIICHVCSTIKPYFDDAPKNSAIETNVVSENNETKKAKNTSLLGDQVHRERGVLERSRTQIAFSSPTSSKTKIENPKKDEKEKLKKMLIEMKNSLPKRKSHILLNANRKSTIDENPEMDDPPERKSSDPNLNKCDVKLAEIDKKIVRKEEEVVKQIKPEKSTSAAQTSAAIIKKVDKNYQLMRPKDFDDIYGEKTGTANITHLYANLAQHENLFLNVPKRFSDMKNSLQFSTNTDTIEINRLLRRLENAIAKGDLSNAAIFARELAQLKVNCSVVRQKPNGNEEMHPKNGFTVEMYVEDRLSHRGPFPIQVVATQTLAELKKQVEREFEIPIDVQRWILGKELATNDTATLQDHHVTSNKCPVFLYLVAPTNNHNKKEVEEEKILNLPDKANTKQKTTEEVITNGHVAAEPKESPRKLSTNTESANATAIILQPPIIVEAKQINVPKTTIHTVLIENKVKPILITENRLKEVPKIVGEQFKSALNGQNAAALDDVAINTPSGSGVSKQPPKAAEEDFSEYDKTLRPEILWECVICTLLNPLTTNICLACCSIRKKEPTPPEKVKRKQNGNNKKHYLELMDLDSSELVLTKEPFECLICLTIINPLGGVTLRECLHQFCKACLAHTIEFCDEAQIKCPYRDKDYSCDIALQDREVKALVTPHVYEQFLTKSVSQAENRIGKSFHCKTPDCKGWCIFEDNVNDFKCPVCQRTNCLTCQAIHFGMNCKQYQERMNVEAETDENAKRTREMLEEMVAKGEALTCPACHVILMKKWGCDWVRCSVCKTEICWVTRGLRWGPAGKGDTSGGCKCGVNGMKCHPQCSYCH